MRFWKKLLILWIIGCFSCVAEAKHKKHVNSTATSRAHTLPRSINGSQALIAEINSIVSSMDGKAVVGVDIKSMKYGDTLYTKNEQSLLTPASIMKIMTAEAALLYLGSEYKFPTTLLTDASGMNGGVINGNVYLVHSGDPTLTYNDLTDLMVTLRSQQIQGVAGNVYIDNTAYDQSNYGPGWEWDDKRSCFAAPINASIINHNCLSLQIEPGSSPGRVANVIESPRYYYAAISNAVMTKQPHTRACYVQLGINDNNTISLSGCMPKGKYVWGVSTTISDVMEYNKSLLQSLFKKFSIRVNGNVVAGTAPPNLSAIATHQSKPLNVLIKEMLKMSDNIIAGSLFKKIGEYYTRQPGSWERGGFAVKKILGEKALVNTAELSVIDGSGLSRDNKVKPAQMMQVLDYAFHDVSTSYEFISALPIAAVDGTLKHRLYNVAGRVRAKTGTMQGVVSLAGYVVNKDKEAIAFVIIVNGRNGNIWQYREMEDKIVTALANYSRG
jgi:D-alanyl-D-alanine carboxypeptidase/D-alanyl-D-alanine-endopeptidase (penicillin-binding protein 4)